MKVYLHFYKRIFVANFMLAFLFSMLSLPDLDVVLRVFAISMPTFAYGLTIYFFDRFKYQYYLYNNLGYTNKGLILFGFLANVVLSILVFTTSILTR